MIKDVSVPKKHELFVSRLKSVRAKAEEEGLTTMRIYQKMREGYYDTVVISGVRFILDKENVWRRK